MGRFHKSIYKGMAAQLDRVNSQPLAGGHSGTGNRSPDEIPAPIRDMIAEQQDRIDQLEADLADARVKAGLWDAHKEAEQRVARHRDRLKGRTTITAREAAHRAGVSYSQAVRYCQSGHWKAFQPDGTSAWSVYADQELTRKTRKRRR